MRSGDSAQQQLEEIEETQKAARKHKGPEIHSIEKSERRLQNKFDRIKTVDDLEGYE